MKFVYIYGTPGSRKSTLELNLRMNLGILGSKNEYPINKGIAVYGSVLYDKKPSKKNVIVKHPDWPYSRPSLDTILSDLHRIGADTFVLQGSIIPFRKEDMEKIKDNHEFILLGNYISKAKNYRLLKNRESYEGRNTKGKVEDLRDFYGGYKKNEDILKDYSSEYARLSRCGNSRKRFIKILETIGLNGENIT